MLQMLNTMSGPLGGAAEKALLALFMYAAGKGWIPGDSVVPLATALYGLLSVSFTAAVQSQTAKIQDINSTTNGVKVVPASAPVMPVDGPLPAMVGK